MLYISSPLKFNIVVSMSDRQASDRENLYIDIYMKANSQLHSSVVNTFYTAIDYDNDRIVVCSYT